MDDDAQLRHSFEKLLLAEGHEVKTSPTGEAGLEIFRNNRPDLVIMDVRLPGMDGLETFNVDYKNGRELGI